MPLDIVFPLLIPLLSFLFLFILSPPLRAFLIAGLFLLLSLFFMSYQQLAQVVTFDAIFFPLSFFSADPIGHIARISFALTGALSIAYTATREDRIFQLVAVIAFSSAILVTLANNFLTFFLFWELITISAAGIIFLKGDEESYKNGWRYLLSHLTGGLIFFLGIMINYQATGSFALARPQAGIPFFILAIGLKTAFVPLHFWLPTGYPAAPFQGSVLLSALTTKAGIFALARLLEPSLAIAYIGGIMAIFGVMMALLQKNMRGLLSYHIISQVGYMVAGIGVGLSLSIDGGLLHLLNHMLYKGLLFMSAGAVIYATGTEYLKNLGGLWRKMPIATISGIVGSLAIAGVPPFNGFISKTMLKYGTKDETFLWWLLMIAGVGTSISFCKFMYFGFFKSSKSPLEVKPLPWIMSAPMLVTAAVILLLGLFPSILQGLAPYGSSTYVYRWSTVRDGTMVFLIGVLVFGILKPFLDPSRVTLPHRLLDSFRLMFNRGMGALLHRIQELGSKEDLITMGNALWVLFFTITFMLSGFLIRILLM